MPQTLEKDIIEAIETEVNEAIRRAEQSEVVTGSVRVAIDAAWDNEQGGVVARVTIKGGHGVKRTAFVKNGQLSFDQIK